jgi:murein L,D-transpeptidase YafK
MRTALLSLAALVVLVLSAAVVIGRGASSTLAPGVVADRIVVEKQARRLTVLKGGATVKSYVVALGRNPIGAKQFEGDGRTPEGEYVVSGRKEDSAFHLALRVSYPTAAERAAAEAQGRSPGGDIMIHGLRNGLGFLGPLHRVYDWTEGCIAVTNSEIEEIWRAVPDGTVVEIRP